MEINKSKLGSLSVSDIQAIITTLLQKIRQHQDTNDEEYQSWVKLKSSCQLELDLRISKLFLETEVNTSLYFGTISI